MLLRNITETMCDIPNESRGVNQNLISDECWCAMNYIVTRMKYCNDALLNKSVFYLNFTTMYHFILSWKSQIFEHLLKDKKRPRLRVIHLIEFIQINNFHIYSIF